jgi:cytochrome c-type biogenesis protein CcmH
VSAFLLIGGVFILVLLTWLLHPLRKPPPLPAPDVPNKNNTHTDPQQDETLAILREEHAQLDEDRAQGRLSKTEHQHACDELERRVLDEMARPTSAPRVSTQRPHPLLIGLVVLVLGGLPWGLYLALGHPLSETFAPPIAEEGGVLRPHPNSMAEEAALGDGTQAHAHALQQRLDAEGGPTEDWETLALLYTALEAFDEADKAYQNAAKTGPLSANTLADWADVLASRQNGHFGEDAIDRLQTALAHDPHNIKALTLAGAAAFGAGRPEEAADFWQRIWTQLDPESPVARSLAQSIATARAQNTPP